MTDQFTCYVCKQTFDKGQSDEDAENELKEIFGSEFETDDCEIVCDDCYKKLMGHG